MTGPKKAGRSALIAATTAAICLWIGAGRGRRVAVALLFAVLVVDQLQATTLRVGWRGLGWPTLPPQAIEQPTVHAARLAAELAPTYQRLLAADGTHLDAVAPAALARLWRIPIAGGYNPMLLERMNDLALLEQNGRVDLVTLGPDDTALDVLAIRYVLLKPAVQAVSERFKRLGVEWEEEALDFLIGRADCGHRYPRQTSVALVTYLRYSEHVPAGDEVVSVTVVSPDGTTHTAPLRAGLETAETGLFDPELQARAQHEPAPTRFGDDADQPLRFFTRVDLPEPMAVTRLELRAPGTGGWTVVQHITLLDELGASHPLRALDMRLRGQRWREVRRFETSRESDRGADVEAPGEDAYILLENQRALPRAWIVPEIVPLDDLDASATFRVAQLPDGRRFDPRQIAIVDAEQASAATFAPGRATASIETIEDGRIRVAVSTDGGGFLVLSEAHYPGWRVSIDGEPASLVRTDLALQGVAIPTGEHVVEFRLAPTSLRLGAGLTLAGLLGCLLVGSLGRLRAARGRRSGADGGGRRRSGRGIPRARRSSPTAGPQA